MDCGLDIRFTERDGEGDFEVEFVMPGAKGTVKRWFKDIESALRMAHFVAAQQGVNTPEKLQRWLEDRGFPGREPAADSSNAKVLDEAIAACGSLSPQVEESEPKSGT